MLNDDYLPIDPLTPRELTTLKLMAAGASTKEIAEAMGIGVDAVKRFKGFLRGKLGYSDPLKCVAWYWIHGRKHYPIKGELEVFQSEGLHDD